MSNIIESEFFPCAKFLVTLATPYRVHEQSPCVYMLIRDSKITYVGQTTTPMFRIGTHSKTKKFDSYFLLAAEVGSLNELEAEAIVTYNPSENLTLPAQKKYMTHAAAAKKHGAWVIKNAAKNGKIRKIDLHIGPVYFAHEVDGLAKVNGGLS